MTDVRSLTTPKSLRAFTLPGDADRDGTSAKFAKGVLELEIAKTANPPAEVKQVAIKAA